MQNEYTFDRNIISGNRVTVPKVVMDQWNLVNEDVIIVTFKLKTKDIKGIVI